MPTPSLHLDGGETVTTKCLLIATGADYRRLDVEECARFEGKGVYYAATPAEGQLCRGVPVVLVGGGNSAGQAAVFLAQHASQLVLLIRGDNLYKSMSSYLARRIEQTPNIELNVNTTIRRMRGDGHLDGVEIVNESTGQTRVIDTPAVFSFIGAVPRTEWLPPEIERDAKGFVRTGTDAGPVPPLDVAGGRRSCWRRAAPASSPPGTSAQDPSSASRRPSAKDRWWSSSSTKSSRPSDLTGSLGSFEPTAAR